MDLKRRMGLVAKQTIAPCHLLVVAVVTTETGRPTNVGAVTSHTIAVMSTGATAGQLFFNLLMTAGTDLTRPSKIRDIIFQRLVRVVTTAAAGAGKVRIVIH